MDSTKRGQRKRKSAGIGDIFEVSDKDLSPEPEEISNEEPEAKVLKSRNSDVSESRQNNMTSNLKNEEEPTKEITILPEKPEEKCDIISDKNVNNTTDPVMNPPILNDDGLEDGEVNDTMVDNVDETILSSGPLEPSITIKFDNKSIADIYKPKFLKFIQSFIELEVENLVDTTINVFRNMYIDPKEWVVLDGDDFPCSSAVKEVNKETEPEEELAKELPVTPKTESPKKKRKKKKQKLEHIELFVVDTNPGVDIRNSGQTQYCTKFLIDEKHNETKEISKPIALSSCFNCGNDHSLKDCPQPKNYGKINANRQKFTNKNKASRYHLEEEQKYSNLQPGKISPALRKALGLKKHQLPSYIYQMRILGYPPGWLEEAKVVESELAMFDIDGNNVKNTNSKGIKGIDPERVIAYPGFNIPLEKEFKDEYKHHRVPPYCKDFSKEKMIDYFRRQCLQNEDDLETQDMDLDNTGDLIIVDFIEEECTEVKTIQNKQLESIIDSDSNTAPSPSLNDLEKQKKSLLEQLKKPEETIPWDYPAEDTSLSSTGEPKESSNDSKENKTKNAQSKKEECKDEQTEPDVVVVEETVCESNESRNTSPLTVSSANTVKHSTFGTPIIKSSTPYNRLPNPDNFSKGVSPVIDFENLPNSTGKYEQMTDVLQKVRNTLRKNQHKTKT